MQHPVSLPHVLQVRPDSWLLRIIGLGLVKLLEAAAAVTRQASQTGRQMLL
jgi:hypothetical protein